MVQDLRRLCSGGERHSANETPRRKSSKGFYNHSDALKRSAEIFGVAPLLKDGLSSCIEYCDTVFLVEVAEMGFTVHHSNCSCLLFQKFVLHKRQNVQFHKERS